MGSSTIRRKYISLSIHNIKLFFFFLVIFLPWALRLSIDRFNSWTVLLLSLLECYGVQVHQWIIISSWCFHLDYIIYHEVYFVPHYEPHLYLMAWIMQVSYMILQRVSPVTHSVGNCVKRVVVIVSSVVFFQTPVSLINSLGKLPLFRIWFSMMIHWSLDVLSTFVESIS